MSSEINGAVSVHSIDHFSITVPRLDIARNFYTEFGLNVVDADDSILLRTSSSNHNWGVIFTGDRKRLHHLTFNCFESDFIALRAKVIAAGVEIIAPPAKGSSDGFWFHDMDGNSIQVQIGPKTMPDHKSRADFESVGEGARGAASRGHESIQPPMRLAHMLLLTPNVSVATDFYERTIGLRVADRGGSDVAFTYAPPWL